MVDDPQASTQDQLTWVGQYEQGEKTISQKLLIIVGGITSFGALLPIFTQNISKFYPTENQKYIFLFFITVYFLLPFLFLLVWLLSSRRLNTLFERKVRHRHEMEKWLNSVQWIFSIALVAEFVIGAIVIFYFKNCLSDKQLDFILIVYGAFLFTLFIMCCAFIIKNQKSIWTHLGYSLMGIVLLGILFWATYAYIYQFRINIAHQGLENGVIKMGSDSTRPSPYTFFSKGSSSYEVDPIYFQDSYAYDQLRQSQTWYDNLNRVEDRTRNIVDRFRLKSMVNHSMLLSSKESRQFIDTLVQVNSKLFINPSLQLLSAIILMNKSDAKDLDESISLPDSISLVKLCNYFSLHYAPEFNDKRFMNSAGLFKAFLEKRKYDSLVFVTIIGDSIYTRLTKDSQLIDLNDISTHSKISASNKLLQGSDSLKAMVADSINLHNSKYLSDWIDDFLAYSERKTQDEIKLTSYKIAWIWQDAQLKGIIIFMSLLITLLLYYVMLGLIKTHIRYHAAVNSNRIGRTYLLDVSVNSDPNGLLEENPTRYEQIKAGEERLKKIKDRMADQLAWANYYLFPVITFIAIIFALLIPLTKEIRIQEINFSTPSWMLNLPTWNLPTAISSTSGNSQTASGRENTYTTNDFKKITDQEQDFLKQMKDDHSLENIELSSINKFLYTKQTPRK